MCPECRRLGFDFCVGKIPWRRGWQTTPVFLPGKHHGQKSLEGYSPWDRIKSDMTEHSHFQSAIRDFRGGAKVMNPPPNARAAPSVPRLGRSPGEGDAIHSSILTWKIQWTKEPGGLQSTGSQRVRHDWMIQCAHTQSATETRNINVAREEKLLSTWRYFLKHVICISRC